MGWLVLQYLLPISWLVGLFCKDLSPISWLVLQGFLFCSILVSVGLPLEWALFTCPTFGHHSDLTIQYNQQAEYIHLDTSDLTTISNSHSLELTSPSTERKPQIQKMKTKTFLHLLRSNSHLLLTHTLALLSYAPFSWHLHRFSRIAAFIVNGIPSEGESKRVNPTQKMTTFSLLHPSILLCNISLMPGWWNISSSWATI